MAYLVPKEQDERRFNYQRRQFHYSSHIPKRRTGQERQRAPQQRQPAIGLYERLDWHADRSAATLSYQGWRSFDLMHRQISKRDDLNY